MSAIASDVSQNTVTKHLQYCKYSFGVGMSYQQHEQCLHYLSSPSLRKNIISMARECGNMDYSAQSFASEHFQLSPSKTLQTANWETGNVEKVQYSTGSIERLATNHSLSMACKKLKNSRCSCHCSTLMPW